MTTAARKQSTLEPFYNQRSQERIYQPTPYVPRSVREWRKRHHNGYREDRR